MYVCIMLGGENEPINFQVKLIHIDIFKAITKYLGVK